MTTAIPLIILAAATVILITVACTPSKKKQKPDEDGPRTTECPDCGGIVSINAKACPHCGRQFEPEKKQENPVLTAIATIFLVIGIIVLLILLFPQIVGFVEGFWIGFNAAISR